MNPVSSELKDRSRKNQTAILNGIARTGQQVAADCIGASVSTISRWQSSEDTKMGLEQIATLLAAVGLKVVPKEMKCYPEDQVDALFKLAKAHMKRMENLDSMLDFEQ